MDYCLQLQVDPHIHGLASPEYVRACCRRIGVTLISIFDAVRDIATLVLTNFGITLRIISIAILVFTYFMIVRDLNRECKVKFDKFRD